MKSKILFSAIFLLLIVVLYTPTSYSSVAFTCNLANDVYTAPNVYEFDIYLLSTGTADFRLCACQFDITYNTAILNGGTLSAELIDASWDPLVEANYEPLNVVLGTGELQIISSAVQKRNNATIITTTAPGYSFGRIRLTNSVPFAGEMANLTFKFTGYNTIVLAFLSTTSGNNTTTDITSQGTFDTSTLTNPILPVELSSFLSNVNGRQVSLSWETKTEINSSKYEIERASVSSKDATVTWASVGIIQAAGNSNSPRKYSFTDKNIQAGKYQYRLKMIDNDGSYKLSDVIETTIALPKSFDLSQNYPNPFNPTTKINYQVPVDAKVIMEVYNITGQKVMELVNQQQSAGYYTVDFGSSKLSSGVYIYRLVASDLATGNNFSSIKKMMLLK